MPPLHPPAALRALADVDVETTHNRPLHREFLLILRRDPDVPHRASAVGARTRQGRGVGLVDVPRRAPMRMRAVACARATTRALRRQGARAARERRGLPIDRAARRVERVFQFVVFAPQPLPFDFRAPQVFLELRDAARLLLDDLLRVLRRRFRATRRHGPVMPDSPRQYKRKSRVPRWLGVS